MSIEMTADDWSIDHTELDTELVHEFRLRFGTRYEQNIDGWVVGSMNNVGIAPSSQETFGENNIDAWEPVNDVTHKQREGEHDLQEYHADNGTGHIDRDIIKQISAFVNCTIDDGDEYAMMHTNSHEMPIIFDYEKCMLIVSQLWYGI